MFWGLVIGLALGYFFKPQLDILVGKVVKAIRHNRRNSSYRNREDRDRD